REPSQDGSVLAKVDRHAVEPCTGPHELSGRAQLIELSRLVVRHAPWQHFALPERNGKRKRLERDERLAQARAPVDPVPARQEPPQRRLLRGLDLLAKGRE